MVEQLGPATEWLSRLQHTPLALTCLERRSDQPDPINGWSRQAPAPVCFVPTVFFSLHLLQTRTQTIQAKRKVQTTNKTIWVTQDCVTYIYIKKKEILEIKHKRNVTFLEARKIARSDMEEHTYASIARRVNPVNQDKKYRETNPLGSK